MSLSDPLLVRGQVRRCCTRSPHAGSRRGALMMLWMFAFGMLILTVLLGNELMFRTNLRGASIGFTEPAQELVLAEAGIEHAMFEFGSAAVYGYGGNVDPTIGNQDGDFGVLSTASPPTGKNEITDGDSSLVGWKSVPWGFTDALDFLTRYCRLYAPGATTCYQYSFPLRTGNRNNGDTTNVLGIVQANVVNPYSRWPVIFSRARIGNNGDFYFVDAKHVGRTIRVELERAGNRFDYAIVARQAAPITNNQASTTSSCHALDIVGCSFVASYRSTLGEAGPPASYFKVGTPPQEYRKARVGTNCWADTAITPQTDRPGYLNGTVDNCHLVAGEGRSQVWGCMYYGVGGTTDDNDLFTINTFPIRPETGCNERQQFPDPPGGILFPSVNMPLTHRCDVEHGAWSVTSTATPIGGQTHCANSLFVTAPLTFTDTAVVGASGVTSGATKIYVRNWVYIASSVRQGSATENRAPEKLQIYLATGPGIGNPIPVGQAGVDAACTSTTAPHGNYHVCIRGTGTKVRALFYGPNAKMGILGEPGTASAGSAAGPFLYGAIMANWVVLDRFAKLYYDETLRTDSGYADYGTNVAGIGASYAVPKIRSWQVISDP